MGDSSVTEERAVWFDLDESVGRGQGSKKGQKQVKKIQRRVGENRETKKEKQKHAMQSMEQYL